ncbi:sigma-54 dependent transcriptional regulator [Rhizobium sp. EC-SD404]|uniref:sigma-54-dependent transcriptional regulator n=1 Tax=Rhizobium sp. EC-SD404 TaxID=2038389 RepID=UPI00125AF09E|nr:sigma-54 dependent transcriptional regulator [Rhizobium sp. EC-SD404]VVS98135.1 Two component, sigma54 specific, transcriptional regulator, Fis family protein [Rhizobium sp. EC-SD404]
MTAATLPDRGSIGLIEDDPVMGGSLVQRLELEGWKVIWWSTGQAALEGMADVRKDLELVICDIRLPDMSGEEVFDAMRGDEDLPPFLFVTGYGEVDQAVRLMRSGAVDFVTKPFRIGDFLTRIGAARRQVVSELDTRGYVLGCSHSIQAVEDLIRRYAMLDLPVLITGETGAGKEVAARLLHDLSPRAKEPFIAVNCAAIPAELLESELFGHEKGAFTGAHQRHLGYAERAKGGTLFLDEIGDMPLPLQVKLLRLMESKSFTRLGGETSVAFRARIVSATHQQLLNSPPTSFREDLYFRLAVLPVEIAPLRERPDDILWLLNRFIKEAGTRSNRRIRGLTVLAEEACLAHFWQGNARELRNRVERAVALAATDRIDIADLFPEQAQSQASKAFATLADVRDAAERRQILRALDETEGHVTKAAELLGLGRTTLWEKMTRLQMAPKKDEAPL